MVAAHLEYLPGHPVEVRVVHRDRRISVTDDGEAVRLPPPAGLARRRRQGGR